MGQLNRFSVVADRMLRHGTSSLYLISGSIVDKQAAAQGSGFVNCFLIRWLCLKVPGQQVFKEEQMDREHPPIDSRGASPQKNGVESDESSEPSPSGGTASQEFACMEKLLLVHWRDLRGKSLTADELLTISSRAFETLFQEPPVGPVPEYLTPHLSVYGCVAEYEEKLEELDRWKALQLGRWLKDRIGRNWRVAGKVYQLQGEEQEGVAPAEFRFRLIEERTGCGKPTTIES
jgi:hypothetical protein